MPSAIFIEVASTPPLEAELSKIKMQNTRKRTRSKEVGPRTASGVRFPTRDVFPGYAKNAYPGLSSLQPYGLATPEACKYISAGWSVFCDTRR